jgi:hypothetical protein
VTEAERVQGLTDIGVRHHGSRGRRAGKTVLALDRLAIVEPPVAGQVLIAPRGSWS